MNYLEQIEKSRKMIHNWINEKAEAELFIIQMNHEKRMTVIYRKEKELEYEIARIQIR